MRSSEDLAAAIVASFHQYNDEFAQLTRRAAVHFLNRDWQRAQQDAVERIELYETWVTRCVRHISVETQTEDGSSTPDAMLWSRIQSAYAQQIARCPDSDFYRTFFNSVCRDIFGTVGVNAGIEFTATSVGEASGAVFIHVYRIGKSVLTAVRKVLADLPFFETIEDTDAVVRRISTEVGRFFSTGRQRALESFEFIQPVFYRGLTACVVGRVIADGSITPLVINFANSARGVTLDAVLMSQADIGSLFTYTRSYFQVDLPVVSAAITLLRSFLPRKPVDELYTVLGRAKQGKSERFFALQRHLDGSIDSFVHAPGERGLVMIVFTLPSLDLVFKVIRDRFGAPKTSSRADVVARYHLVFRHDRAGRLVDAQEFKRLSLPRARFMQGLADELLREAAETCRIEGEHLIVEHCYIERRLRPLDLFLREADPAAAEFAIIDYGAALRDLAASNVFPGDLLLKNFGVTHHGRVIFYDYDELCLVTECTFRDIPEPRSEEEEFSSEAWFYYGDKDVFPEQWLPFLGIPDSLREVFLDHHRDLLTPGWWRSVAEHNRAIADVRPLPSSACLTARRLDIQSTNP